jgi:hypothetical protein
MDYFGIPIVLRACATSLFVIIGCEATFCRWRVLNFNPATDLPTAFIALVNSDCRMLTTAQLSTFLRSLDGNNLFLWLATT